MTVFLQEMIWLTEDIILCLPRLNSCPVLGLPQGHASKEQWPIRGCTVCPLFECKNVWWYHLVLSVSCYLEVNYRRHTKNNKIILTNGFGRLSLIHVIHTLSDHTKELFHMPTILKRSNVDAILKNVWLTWGKESLGIMYEISCTLINHSIVKLGGTTWVTEVRRASTWTPWYWWKYYLLGKWSRTTNDVIANSIFGTHDWLLDWLTTFFPPI